jgi:hypothetical protein
MSYRRRGLYKVRQEGGSKKVAHYGILDVGNCLRRPDGSYFDSVIIHQTPPGLRHDSLHDFGPFKVVRTIRDVEGAIRRYNQALENPRYDLFGNNCEHFAGYVETGRRESGQLQGFVVLGILAAILIGSIASARA